MHDVDTASIVPKNTPHCSSCRTHARMSPLADDMYLAFTRAWFVIIRVSVSSLAALLFILHNTRRQERGVLALHP